MPGVQLSRDAVLGYRASAHDLEQPVASPDRCGILEVGVQDTPAGATAGPALRARLATTDGEDPPAGAGLVLVHSLRGAMHVHRDTDLGLLVASLRPDDPAEAARLDEVAGAMTVVTADGRSRSKGELSTELTKRLPARLRPWCPTCAVEHVPDGLFRAATLPAGLQLRPVGQRRATFWAAAAPEPADRERARGELLRRYLRRCGPTAAGDLARWAGIEPGAARRWWTLVADELTAVSVDGIRLWIHGEDLERIRDAIAATAVRLLPAYDPLVEVAHRKLLLDAGHRREVWRAVANPGVVVVAGEIAGTWRQRQRVLTIAPFRPLSGSEQEAIRAAAATWQPAPVEVTVRN